MFEIDKDRLKEIEALQLRHGKHESFEKGACVMEMVSWLAREPWSDHPACACPALTAFAIRINDRTDDEMRQKLKPLIPKLVGTRDSKTKARAEFLAHHAITIVLPILMDALNMPDDSAKLRAFHVGQWKEMQVFCEDLRPKIRKAAAAAYAAAAADAAAYAAADAAAYAAADAAAYAAADRSRSLKAMADIVRAHYQTAPVLGGAR